MDTLDEKLITLIQHHFPVTSRPYEKLACQLGTDEKDVLNRLQRLRASGKIRRIGGVFDSKKLGYVSTLCAVQVPEEEIKHAAKLINSLPGVTHHYVRKHPYNLWFTLISPSKKTQDTIIFELEDRLQKMTKSGRIINLPAKRVFKIKVQFNAGSTGGSL
ncbi:siroheme decarboxylase subunit alpha [Tindallia californiensis]|uniref:siroheme decarboxylase n=1 Tax=Tindallia californiensis TaxID=159292 RepID=A0A1H3MLM9_9FIRM|nr:AsnC family transcriptional regulator [Tindallia californiensis]SDY77631.1 DNA-binding transcriptional regulator, Lrp family [Tindallia californiensis]